MRKTAAIAFAAMLAVLPAVIPARAAEPGMTLEDELNFLQAEYMVESASRYAQKVSEAPASVTIITAEEFRRYGRRNIDDVLRAVIGLYVTNDRNYSYLGLRGFGLPSDFNSRVLLLLDGHRMNDPIYGQAAFGWESGIDLGEVEKIEVVRGPSSALYGTSAFLGIINVVTRKPAGEPEGEAQVFLGEPVLTGASARAGGKKADFGYALDVHAMRRKGHHILAYPDFACLDLNEDGLPDYTGFAVDEDGETAWGMRAGLSWGNLSLTGFFSRREKDIPTASYETVFDAGVEESLDRRGFLELAYNGRIGESLSWSAKASYDEYLYMGWYPYPYAYDNARPDYARPPYTMMKDDHPSSWWGVEFQADYTGLKGHYLVLGGGYNANRVRMRTFDVDPPYVYQDDRFNFYAATWYAQDEITLVESLRLVAGINHNMYDPDVFKGDVDRFNPRIGLVWTSAGGTAVKVLYGEAFRVPSLYELYYNDGGLTQIPNPELKPEIMRTAELVVERDLGRGFRLELSGYQNRIENLIQAVNAGEETMQFRNSPDDVVSSGLEATLRKALGGRFSGYAALAVQKTKNDRTGEDLPNSPKLLANVGFSCSLSEVLIASLDGRYVGERKGVAPGRETDGYFVTDITLLATGIAERLEVSFSIYNLFDVDFADPGSFDLLQEAITQDGRNYGLQAAYRF